MKLPRDLDAEKLVTLLAALEYKSSNTSGSHIRLTTRLSGEQHITIPRHSPLKVGTLNAILRDVERHFSMSREELFETIFKVR